MRNDRHFDADVDPGLDDQLRAFFGVAAQPPIPPGLEITLDRLPERQAPRGPGLLRSWRHPATRPGGAIFVGLSLAVVVALAAGLVGLRGAWNVNVGPGGPSGSPTSSAPVSGAIASPSDDSSGYTPELLVGRTDSRVGWILYVYPPGNTTLRLTLDGGATWSEPRPAPIGVLRLQFADGLHGWGVRATGETLEAGSMSVTVYRTVDGGRSWQDSTITVGTLAASTSGKIAWASFHFSDTLHGRLWAAYGSHPNEGYSESGEPSICAQYSTDDGGVTWSAAAESPCVANVMFVDGSLGYGLDPFSILRLHVTTDGGRTWTSGALPSRSPNALNLAAGVQGLYVGLLERAADGTLRALVFEGGYNDASVLASADGGRTWKRSGATSGFDATAAQPWRLGDGHWLVFTESGSPDYAAEVFVTTDAGVTWTRVAARGLAGSPASSGLTPVSTTDAWALTYTATCPTPSARPGACDVSANLLATTDSGASWTRILTP